MHPGRVVAVNVMHRLIPDVDGDLDSTGIDKRPVAGRVRVGRLGVEGDLQVNTRHHGGPDQAVYAYAVEGARWWAEELGREIPPGRLGENLTTEGIAVTESVVGERWQVGTTLLQPVLPRMPCSTLTGFWGVPRLLERFTERGDCGAYIRVLEEGDIAAGDLVEVVDRPGHGITVGDLFRAHCGERDLIGRIADVEDLPAGMRGWAQRVAKAHRAAETRSS